jgi:hypothetical protein
MKPQLFGFGYSFENVDPYKGKSQTSRKIMLATPQKAILDFFYINNYYNTEKDVEDLRLNGNELEKIINTEFYNLLEKFRNTALERRIQLMIKTYGL